MTKSDAAKKKLVIVVIICFVWMIVEIIYSMITNSLALLTDAVDLLKDIAEFGINIVCINYAKRKSSDEHTFGFLKAESLGAFVSIILIWVFYSLLLVESIVRIVAGGSEVESGIMLYISCIALLLNIIKTCILASDEIGGGGDDDKEEDDKLPEVSDDDDEDEDEEDKKPEDSKGKKEKKPAEEEGEADKEAASVRAAIINLLGDIFKSIGIIVVALILKWQPNWDLIDPIYTLVLSIIIIGSTISLADECIHELIVGAPEDLDVKKLRKDLERIKGVEEIHDLHVWNLIEGTIAISVHVLTERTDRDAVLTKATKICHKYKIFHTTIQV